MEIYSAEAQKELGRRIASQLQGGEILALTGDLGAGKTTLTQGIAEGLGVKEQVTSPTFTLLETYASGRIPLCHIDAYRIEEAEHLKMLGFDDALDGETVIVVEWAERIASILPSDYTEITIQRTPEGRSFAWRDYGKAKLAERLDALCS